MMFDTKLAVQNVELTHNPEDEHTVLLGIVTGMMMPIVDPQSGQAVGAVPVPIGINRYAFEKAHPEQLSQVFADAAEKLEERPKPSDLVVPGSPDAAAKMAQDMGRLKGNGS